MTSTIHHPVAVPSRGLIICEMEEESNEPKTILEIGGVSRPTYIIPTPTRPQPLPASIGNQPYLGHWKAQPDIVPSPYPAFTEFQEQKIVRLTNANWSGALEKLQANQTSAINLKGIFHGPHSVFPFNFTIIGFFAVFANATSASFYLFHFYRSCFRSLH